MDYEKKYKDALERAKYWEKNPTVWSSDDICQKLFPEIIEKKDERIKSCIGMCLTDADNQRFEDYKTSLKDCLAWLEKQDDYNKLVEEMKERKKLFSKERKEATSVVDRLSLGGRIAILEELLAFTKEKQNEQEPAWSEEDEKMMQCIHKYVKASASNFDYDNIQIWFRNLKNRVQPHWKPTKEQIYALSMAYKDSLAGGENLPTQTETLKSLYNDLKKL